MSRPTLFLDALTVLDFAFLDSESGLNGESWHVEAELTGALDHRGFVMDFGPAKKLLKNWIDTYLDHRLALPLDMAGMSWEEQPEGIQIRARGPWGSLEYQAPREALAWLPGTKVSPLAVATYLEERIRPHLPASVTGLKLRLREEPRFATEACYRYTHGLRFHEGNCQRLLHGHRNPVEIWQDGRRQPEAETALAKTFSQRHFASRETVVNARELDLVLGMQNAKDSRRAELRYRAPQGAFVASLPVGSLVLLDTEPSAENIALFAAEWVKRECKLSGARVKIYEGINKGAWA